MSEIVISPDSPRRERVLVKIDPRGHGLRTEGAVEDAIELTAEKMNSIAEAVAESGAAVINAVLAKLDAAKKVTVEFSVGLKGQAGVPFIASASTECSFKISLEWSK
jgi:hypothetical protein